MYETQGKGGAGRIVEAVAIAAITTLATLSVNDLYTDFQIWRKKQKKRRQGKGKK